MGAFFHLSNNASKGNSGISKNKGASLSKSVPNSRLRKFCFSISIGEMCYQLSSRQVDSRSVINWTVVDQLSVLLLSLVH